MRASLTALVAIATGALCLPSCTETVSESGFTHPGIMHSCDDLDRIRTLKESKKEPWVTAWDAVFNRTTSVLRPNNNWKMRGPLDWVLREPKNGTHHWIHDDGRSAYYAAIAWYATGEQYLLDRSINIVRQWANTLVLLNDYIYGGTGIHHLSAAAEILRASSGSGWGANDTEAYIAMYKRLDDNWKAAEEPYSLGLDVDSKFGNQGLHGNSGLLGLAVFSDNVEAYDRVIERATYGRSEWQVGDWALNRFVNNDTDQLLESGRDQPHAALYPSGMSLLAETINIQGQVGERYADLYYWGNNSPLKRGLIYWLTYNYGYDVEFERQVMSDTGDVYDDVSTKGRAQVPGRGNSPFVFLGPLYYHYAARGEFTEEELNLVKHWIEVSGPAYEIAFFGNKEAPRLKWGLSPNDGGAYLAATKGKAKNIKVDGRSGVRLRANSTITYAGNLFSATVSSRPNLNILARAPKADAKVELRNGTSDGFILAEGTLKKSSSFSNSTLELKGDGNFLYNQLIFVHTSEDIDIARIVAVA